MFQEKVNEIINDINELEPCILVLKNRLIEITEDTKRYELLWKLKEKCHDASILNAFIEQKLLYQIDDLLIRIIKLTKIYDRGKEWKKLQNECNEALRQLIELNYFNIPNDE